MNDEISRISIDKMVQKKLSNYCEINKIKIVKFVDSILEAYFNKPKTISIKYNTNKMPTSIIIYKPTKDKLVETANKLNKSTKTLLEEIIMYNIK